MSKNSHEFRLLNITFRKLRPFVKKWREKVRLRKINEDVSRLLPALLTFDLKATDVVIDLGANRGDFTIWSLNKGATVLSFEPHPEAFDYLAQRTARRRNVSRIQAAVSNKSKLTSIYVHPSAREDQLGFSIRASIKNKGDQFVPYSPSLVIDFEELISNVGRVEILKVDIEGSELEIWPIIKKYQNAITFLLIEVHDSMNPGLRADIESFIQERKLSKFWTADWV
jgi:FkbM family methyltransferase